MIRNTVVAVALCLVLIATFGAGVVTARQGENPSQAGSSSVSFYDVAANTTPAGVVAGTWHPPLYGLCITNYGVFVSQLACYYSTDDGVTWHESAHINGIALFKTDYATLEELGVPENALVKIHIEVVGGKDRTGSEVFEHLYTNCWEGQHWASYTITGTTWNPSLVYDGYYPWIRNSVNHRAAGTPSALGARRTRG